MPSILVILDSWSIRVKNLIKLPEISKAPDKVEKNWTFFLISPWKHLLWVLISFVCVEVLQPSQPNGVMSSMVSLPTTLLLGRLSPLSGWPVLCTFFYQKLITALFCISRRERMTVANISWSISTKECCWPGEVEPATSWSPVRHASNRATEAGQVLIRRGSPRNKKNVERKILWGYPPHLELWTITLVNTFTQEISQTHK